MIKTLIANLFLLNMNGKGFIDDDTIMLFIAGIVIIHLLCIAAYHSRSIAFRIVCAIAYVPILIIGMFFVRFFSAFIIILLALVAFFYFTILRSKE